jgi:outer membrane immunogenic protein
VTRKGYLLATASSVAAVVATGGAQAADMPLKAPPPTPIAAPNWAGWYIGLNAGANWQKSADSIGYANGVESGADTGGVSTRASGFIGGGQIGYNWQNSNFVYGLEADISGLTGRGNATAFADGSFGGKTFSNQITWLSTVRARAGFVVGDNTLLYATGGLAVGGVKNTFTGVSPPYIGFNKSESKARAGWTVGGGIEHMLWNSHWTVALEGLFVDLGHSSVTATGPGGAKTAHFSNQAAIGRLKLNYKF